MVQGPEAEATEVTAARGREDGATGDAATTSTEGEEPDGANVVVEAAEGEFGPQTTREASGSTVGATRTKVRKSGCEILPFFIFSPQYRYIFFDHFVHCNFAGYFGIGLRSLLPFRNRMRNSTLRVLFYTPIYVLC